MTRVCDIYLPLDSRPEPNAVVWPVALRQLERLVASVRRHGFEPRVLNPAAPVRSVAEGIAVAKAARGERFIDFLAGWAYPDFSVTPLAMVPSSVPKLLIGSLLSDFPGAVGLFAARSGLGHVGIATSRLFIEDFEDTGSYDEALDTFLRHGVYAPSLPTPIEVPVADADRSLAARVAAALRGQVYGVVGPRSMQMWNKISDADFLRYFGIAREGFDGLRLFEMSRGIDRDRARRAVQFLRDNGLEVRRGSNDRLLTDEMLEFQMQVYFALLALKDRFGLDFLGVQDQLDWIEHLPATDLTLGLLNNRLRPEGDGNTVVAATEADDGAAITMQVLKLLVDGDPVGFNDLRYWDPRQGLYWFVNSGSLAPYFAYGRHDSLAGAWTEHQTPMYFKNGGGTCSVVVRAPGVVTWARFSYAHHEMVLYAGRGVTDVPSEETWRHRSARCSADWPHWYLKLCGRVEWILETNHPMTVRGDHLGALRALAEILGMKFICCDHRTPEEIARGVPL